MLGLLLAVLLTASTVLAAPKPAQASINFTVNSTGDSGTGGCNSTKCTLREAIAVTNRVSGADTIRFNIPGGGVKTIKPTSSLPTITETVTIDGYTQPGAPPNMLAKGTNALIKIELDGPDISGNQDGLLIRASDTVVRGLVVYGFDQGMSGIRIEAFGTSITGVKVEGNFIGTEAAGTQVLGNSSGVTISTINSGSVASANIIGGTTPGAQRRPWTCRCSQAMRP